MVYDLIIVDPFYLVDVPAKFAPGFGFLMRKQY